MNRFLYSICILTMLLGVASCKENGGVVEPVIHETYVIVNGLDCDVELRATIESEEIEYVLESVREYSYNYTTDMFSGGHVDDSSKIPFHDAYVLEFVIPERDSIKLYGSSHPEFDGNSNWIPYYFTKTEDNNLVLTINQEFLERFK